MALTISNAPNTSNISLATGGSPGSIYQPGATTANIQTKPLTVSTAPNTSSIYVPGGKNPAPTAGTGANLQATTNQLLSQYGGVPAPVYAPKLDLAAISAQARSAAENNVNPYYTKELNDFLAQQASTKAQQQAQTDTNIQNLKDTLTNTQAANETTGNRATEDTATKEAGINQAADWRQTDQGGQYDLDRVAQAVQQAKSGLTGSGIAGGQSAASQDKFNTTESRQATQDTEDKVAAELSKARTFEDLATSNKLAGETEAKGEKQANVDLTNFITNQGFDLKNEQDQLEQKRLAAVSAETQNQSKLLINNFINSIANPAQRQAAIQAYGGAF